MQLISICSIGLLIGHAPELTAYEIETHADMSREAAKTSVLKDTTPSGVLRTLGLNYPIEENVIQVFPNSKTGEKKSILELIRDGARFEDTLIRIPPRPLNHFFDPVNNRPLTVAGISVGEKSPDWALEDNGSIGNQGFSYLDAQNYFYQALTATSQADHDRNFGMTFQILGHVIHHIQDMAQPQHVRNDPHCDAVYCIGPFRNPSRYEKYTDTHRGELPYTADPVTFPNARAFWTNDAGTGIAQFTNRNFVSAGTNFQLLNGQPAVNSTYSRPQPTGSETPIDIQQLFTEANMPPPRDQNGNLLQGDIVFIGSDVDGVPNSRASTLSIFDQDLKTYNTTVDYDADPFDPTSTGQVIVDRLFTLNQFNFRAAYPFLIPKAVAYSAGMIDYFFRGKLEAEDVTFTDTGITLKVKNAIDPKETPAWADEILYVAGSQQQPSTLTIAYEYKDATGDKAYGVSDTVTMTTEPGGINGIAPGQTSQNVYSFPLSIPSQATEVKYRLVFRGKLGQEDDAVAVGAADPASGFVFYPTYTPADGIAGTRVIHKQGGQWRLSDQQNRNAGNIDWKGWYQNGRPTKVLSWAGPSSRYFPGSYDPASPKYFGRLGTSIFQDGEVFAIAPCGVYGAALNRDSAGREWLVVVCRNGAADVVFRRPNAKSASQTGWVEIGRFGHDPALLNPANAPWFFNGSGTEAQTIRSGHKAGDPKLRLFRLKITITDNSAVFSNEGNLDIDANVGAATKTKACNASPSVPGVCASDCSGGWTESSSSGSQATSHLTWSGSNIIAVDYIEDTPVFATYTATTDVTFILQYSYNVIKTNVCNGRASSGACLIKASEEIRSETAGEGSWNTVTKIEMTDLGDIIVESTTGGFKADHTSTDNGINNVWTTTTDAFGGGDFQYTTSRLRYLDLRYGLYSLYSTTRTSSGQTTNVGANRGDISISLPTITTIKQVTGFGGINPVNQIALPETLQTFGVGSSLFSDVTCGGSASTPGAPHPVLMDPAQIIDGGSWAVDSNKNLFESETKLDENMQPVGHFNYLTGATGNDPTSVIPTAPLDAYYDNIGVIK